MARFEQCPILVSAFATERGMVRPAPRPQAGLQAMPLTGKERAVVALALNRNEATSWKNFFKRQGFDGEIPIDFALPHFRTLCELLFERPHRGADITGVSWKRLREDPVGALEPRRS